MASITARGATPNQGTPFTQWFVGPPFEQVEGYGEAANIELLRRSIAHLAVSVDQLKIVAPRKAAEIRRMTSEFRNFVRQADEYLMASTKVEGSSASLLIYYASLQLAKAELLLSDPSKVLDAAVHHGLRCDVKGLRGMQSDSVLVRDGAFSYLYAKRTGQPPPGRIPVRRALQNVPEVMWEYNQVYPKATPRVFGVVNAAVCDAAHAWNVIAVHGRDALSRNPALVKRLRVAYNEVVPQPEWRARLAITPRSIGSSFRVFESRMRWPYPAGDEESRGREMLHALRHPLALGSIIESPHEDSYEATLVAPTSNSDPTQLPTSLARYVVLFYLSTLVRYKPSLLDRRDHPEQAWIADAFADQCKVHVLRGAVEGISGKAHLFAPPGALRL